MELTSKSPTGPIETRWDRHRFNLKLVNPANKRKYTIIVVGSGLAGGSAAASLAELGYNVLCFCFQDSPRRAHSIAAQGGINAAKNYHNDGDSVYRLFYDTVKGGDFRARESNVYRLAAVSLNIIDQGGAQGVPFAREDSRYLDNRSFRGAHGSRTLYALAQTRPPLLPGAYQSKLTLMSESLRNDGRVWVPLKKGDKRPPSQIPEAERDYFLERKYPSFGNLVPRDVASRNAKAVCDEGRGVGPSGLAVYLDFRDAIQRLGVAVIKERYGNLFDMYNRITGEDPYKEPMRTYPPLHHPIHGP